MASSTLTHREDEEVILVCMFICKALSSITKETCMWTKCTLARAPLVSWTATADAHWLYLLFQELGIFTETCERVARKRKISPFMRFASVGWSYDSAFRHEEHPWYHTFLAKPGAWGLFLRETLERHSFSMPEHLALLPQAFFCPALLVKRCYTDLLSCLQ